MADNNITINQGAGPHAADLSQALKNLQSARAKLTFIKDRMDQMTDGTVWTTVETHFGIPTGKGDEVYNLISGALTQYAGTAGANNVSLRDLLGWVGLPP